ncbi:MAG: hypothetical protein JNK25_09390 [Phycisphaerae bacterium]|nr:hypothetical protein [Phycisphaerae bacterium]
MKRPPAVHGTARFRRGGAYLAALGLGMLVVATGVGALATARVRSRTANLTLATAAARENARSAVELGRAIISRNSNWRTARANGEWITGQQFGVGTITLSVQNPNGALNRSELDPVVLTGTGDVGLARQSLSAQLEAVRTPLSCLTVPMSSGGLVTLNYSNVNPTGGPITSNGGITSVLATLNGDAEAVGSILGTGFRGKTTTGVAPRVLPSSSVAAPYIADGTAIPISSLPATSGVRYLRQTLLSPRTNPFGPPNAAGIYIIDCASQKLIIDNCRIVGTLVILNPAAGSEVRNGVHWTPAISNYPCLIVMGGFGLALSATTVSESSIGVNLNPPGAPYPYPSGSSNTTTTDTYPTIIDGLVYIAGTANLSGTVRVDLLIAGGAINAGGTVHLTYDDTYAKSPPPGFYTVMMRLASGSWRRVVAD